MALRYTFDDFKKAAMEAGVYETFSEHDLRLAERDPSAGMSLLRYKTDWKNAGTDEARALASAGAESVRRTYGGYTGGSDGTGYYLETPSGFTYDRPEPVYNSRYADAAKAALDEVTGMGSFSYDHTTDPVYSAYKKQYAREGKRATEDTLGSFAAASGGIPSSYAVTAASEAGDYYAAQMSDKIPELYEAAYGRYLDEYNAKLNKYGSLKAAESEEYSRYLDELGRYDAEKEAAYGRHLDSIGYYDDREREAYEKSEQEKAAEAAAKQQEFENSLALDSLAAEKNADEWKKKLAFDELEASKNTDAWKKQSAFDELAEARNQAAGAEARRQNGDNGIHGDSTVAGAPPEAGGNTVRGDSVSVGANAAGNAAKAGDSILRRLDNAATKEEKKDLIVRWLQAGTISEKRAEALMKRAGIDLSKYGG